MVVAGRERVGDLMQDCVAHLINAVEQCERARQRDDLAPGLKRSEATAGVIEAKAPIVQAVCLEQTRGQMSRFEEIHVALFFS